MNRIMFSYIILLFINAPIFSQIKSLESLPKCLIRIQVNNTNKLLLDSTGIIEEDYSLGTGFYISEDGLFLTAAHVIKDRNKDNEGSISCYDSNSENPHFVPIVIFEDTKTDIALLQNVNYTNYGKRNKYYFDLKNYNKEANKVNLNIYSFGFPNEFQGYDKITSFSVGKVLEINTDLEGFKKLPERRNVSLSNTVVLAGCSGGIITDFSFNPIGLILGSILQKNKRTTYFKSIYDVKSVLIDYEIY